MLEKFQIIWGRSNSSSKKILPRCMCVHSKFSSSNQLSLAKTERHLLSSPFFAPMTGPNAWIAISTDMFKKTFPTLDEAKAKAANYVKSKSDSRGRTEKV